VIHTKRCGTCKDIKDLTSFYNSKDSRDGKGSRCKPCDNLARRKWTRDNRDASTLSQRRRNLQHKYGITIEDYNEMFNKQLGLCAICGCDETSMRVHHRLAVDHCHDTNKIRGLLCNQCNRAIGMLHDNWQTLEKATNYLRS